MMLLRCVVAISAMSVLSLRAGIAVAQDSSDARDYWDQEVVTPSGQPSRVSEAPSTTFVIQADEIRRSGATTLPEILRRVPGLDVRTITSSDGQLGLRGFAHEITDRILVLVDGRTVYIDFFGGTAYEMLPVSLVDIEKIEVVLGPGASVYGNKAMLGTVNLVTRSAEDYPYAEARLDGGPPGEGRGGARVGVRSGPWRLRATGLARRLTPFDGAAGRDPVTAGGGTLSLGYSPHPGASVALEVGAMRGDAYVMPFGGDVDRFDGTLSYARVQGRLPLGGPGSPLGALSLDLVWNRGRLASDTFQATAGGFRASYDTPYARLHHEVRWRLGEGAMHARWGAEARLNTLDSTVTTGERDLWNVAAFASNEAKLGAWRLTAGLRLDRSTLTRFHLSPRLSVVWSPVERHQLRAAFNTGYNDAHLLHYYADLDLSPDVHLAGNKDLAAERVLYGELGWTGELTGWLRAFASAFAYRLADWISLDPASMVGRDIRYGNNDALDVYGGEVGVDVVVRRNLGAYATYAFLGPTGVPAYPYGADPHASPRHKVGAGFRAEHPSGAYATADAQLFGPSETGRVSQDPNATSLYERTPLGRYLMTQARLGWHLRRPDGGSLDVSLAVSNAFDDRTPHFASPAEAPVRRGMATVAWYR